MTTSKEIYKRVFNAYGERKLDGKYYCWAELDKIFDNELWEHKEVR